MAEMTDDQVNRVLAKLVGKDGHYFKPTLGRDNLAEVLAKLTPEQLAAVKPVIIRQWCEVEGDPFFWLLTCDPAIIARAVAEVVSK